MNSVISLCWWRRLWGPLPPLFTSSRGIRGYRTDSSSGIRSCRNGRITPSSSSTGLRCCSTLPVRSCCSTRTSHSSISSRSIIGSTISTSSTTSSSIVSSRRGGREASCKARLAPASPCLPGCTCAWCGDTRYRSIRGSEALIAVRSNSSNS